MESKKRSIPRLTVLSVEEGLEQSEAATGIPVQIPAISQMCHPDVGVTMVYPPSGGEILAHCVVCRQLVMKIALALI